MRVRDYPVEAAIKRARRQIRWDNGERPVCRAHPDRIVNRQAWVVAGRRVCASCDTRGPDGRRTKQKRRAKNRTTQRKRDRQLFETNPRAWVRKLTGA